jgi:hypothetical protein
MNTCPYGEMPDHCSYASTSTVTQVDPVTEEQLRNLRSMYTKLGITQAQFAEMTQEYFGCDPEGLSKMQACSLMAHLAIRMGISKRGN